MNRNFAEPIQAVSAWLDAQKDFENIPSISAGIVVGQELIWSDGFGYSDLNLKIKSKDSTIYSICSVSKIFTSIAILQLRDQGKLELEDAISIHLPWINIEQSYIDSKPITIKSLLTHSSGLPKDFDFPYFTDPNCPFPSQSQLRAKLSKQKTLYPASTYFQYSNLGMSIIGRNNI